MTHAELLIELLVEQYAQPLRLRSPTDAALLAQYAAEDQRDAHARRAELRLAVTTFDAEYRREPRRQGTPWRQHLRSAS